MTTLTLHPLTPTFPVLSFQCYSSILKTDDVVAYTGLASSLKVTVIELGCWPLRPNQSILKRRHMLLHTWEQQVFTKNSD